MTIDLIVSTFALLFAALNIVLLLSILSRLTSVDESPRAWNFLTLGLGLVVIQFSISVFIMVNPYCDFLGMHIISSSASLFGFGFLFVGVYRIWEVVYS